MNRRSAAVCLSVVLLGCSGPERESTQAPPSRPAPSPPTDVRGEEIAYEVGGVRLNGYIAWDAARKGPRPGVLVVHEWWGHNEYARMRARMLAEMGYTALAVDMYGDGKVAEHPADAEKFMTEVASRLDVLADRFTAARELLEAQPTTDPSRTAAIGYCFGGAVVLHMARLGTGLAGVASFHGDLVPRTEAAPEAARTRVLVLHGADDPFVAPESIDAFRREMAEAGIDFELIAYPGAVHSFTNPGATEIGERFDMPLAYDEAADRQS
ncbi:MAG: dienelactone hydrolase family protein, partial [Thermoanaerobaculia bacterium]|nr:dienelactone hydrolase family protein [Thermoanaerobaculia bacterium]